jgi:hypothetical protein
MKKLAFLGLFAMLIMSGCSTKMTTTNLAIDGSKMEFQKIGTYKQGKSCIAEGFFGRNGSTSIADAAKNGGISTILYGEASYNSELKQTCTIVYGE